jgi:hypothetical protein
MARRSDGGDTMRRGYARAEERNAERRAALTPLGPDERPPALKAAIAVAVGLALVNVVLFAAGVEGGSGPLGLVFVVVMAIAAYGMWNRRYWAVLGFEILLGLIAVTFSAFLLIASNLAAAALCAVVVVASGWLFWKLIRVMGRLQAPGRSGERVS